MSVPVVSLPVALPQTPYTIHIGIHLLARAADFFPDDLRGRRAVLITQPEIHRWHGAAVLDSLDGAGHSTSVLLFEPGESLKTLDTVQALYDGLYESDPPIDRKTVIVALGGGVVGDVAGFVAATYLRGLPYIQIPTTLLAMVDSAVGGKTGVDFRYGKNLVGAFHQPAFVVADVGTLGTLPARETRQALAEIIKYGIIADGELLDSAVRYGAANEEARALLAMDMVRRCCAIKADVVVRDEREETGIRAGLNFGHTVGHALESATQYARYKHGEAVAIGMVAAAYIGEEAGTTPPDVRQRIVHTVRECGLPCNLPPDVSDDVLLALALRDKKADAGRVRFVLAEAIGRVTPPISVPVETVRAALGRMRRDELPSEVAPISEAGGE